MIHVYLYFIVVIIICKCFSLCIARVWGCVNGVFRDIRFKSRVCYIVLRFQQGRYDEIKISKSTILYLTHYASACLLNTKLFLSPFFVFQDVTQKLESTVRRHGIFSPVENHATLAIIFVRLLANTKSRNSASVNN